MAKKWIQVSLLIEEEEKTKLKVLMAKKNQTMTKLFQAMLDEYIAKKKAKGEWE